MHSGLDQKFIAHPGLPQLHRRLQHYVVTNVWIGQETLAAEQWAERHEVKPSSKCLSWPMAKHEITKDGGGDAGIVSSACTGRSCSFLGGCLEMTPVDSSVTPNGVHFCEALNSCKSSFFLFYFFKFFSAWVLPGSAACLNLLCQSAIFLLALSSWVLQCSSVSQSGRANTFPAWDFPLLEDLSLHHAWVVTGNFSMTRLSTWMCCSCEQWGVGLTVPTLMPPLEHMIGGWGWAISLFCCIKPWLSRVHEWLQPTYMKTAIHIIVAELRPVHHQQEDKLFGLRTK